MPETANKTEISSTEKEVLMSLKDSLRSLHNHLGVVCSIMDETLCGTQAGEHTQTPDQKVDSQ